MASWLEEPYSTLVIFLAATGLRIEEAVGIEWSDFEGEEALFTFGVKSKNGKKEPQKRMAPNAVFRFLLHYWSG